MDLSQFQNLGYGTAAAVAAIVVATALFRKWKRNDARDKELKDAEREYRDAVSDGDPDWINAAATRLQNARKASK